MGEGFGGLGTPLQLELMGFGGLKVGSLEEEKNWVIFSHFLF